MSATSHEPSEGEKQANGPLDESKARRWRALIRRRWRVVIYLLLGIAFLVSVLINDPQHPTGYVVSGGIVAAAGFAGGAGGIRFLTPFGIALSAGWLVGEVSIYGAFYATTALIVPILILAATVEHRSEFRDEVRTLAHVAAFGLTLIYLLAAEYASLHGVARCDPSALCDDARSLRFIARGLAGGFASIVVVAMLPRPGQVLAATSVGHKKLPAFESLGAQALETVRTHPGARIPEIADGLGLPTSVASAIARRLVGQTLETTGTGSGTRYWMAGEARVEEKRSAR